VLVGHSFSGFTVRLYQNHYPQDVAGMLLVDVGHEDQFTHPEFRTYYDWNSRKNSVMRGAAALGIIHLAMSSDAIPPSDSDKEIMDKLMKLAPDERAMVIAGWCRSRTWKTVADEIGTDILKETAAQVKATDSLGDLPLVVLTIAIGPNWMPGFPTDQLRHVWMQMQ
jgi:pimeloyl-ACP methyl ester carboxylesterase